MVLFKRKAVEFLSSPSLRDDTEIWVIEETGEYFDNFEDYTRRNDFYRLKRFAPDNGGKSGLTFRDALAREKEASGEIDDTFPEPLKEPILRKVQFQQINRIDYIVDWIYEDFKNDYYPGENIIVTLNDERYIGQIKEKAKFPELSRPDGSIERKSFARYFCHVDDGPQQDALVDEDCIARERKTFTKLRLRSFLKNSITRDAWSGAPWLVKQKLAGEYRIPTDIPPHLTQDFQIKQRNQSQANEKKGDVDEHFFNFPAYGPQGAPQFQQLKPRGKKAAALEQQSHLPFSQFLQYHQPNVNFPVHMPPGWNGFPQGPPPVNGFPPIVAKGQPKYIPPPPKYPIEDLEIPPARDGTHRPNLKYLSEAPEATRVPGQTIHMDSVGPLLETWNTLNVYCEVFQLDSFTFDDYVDALRLDSETVLQCELVTEIHCAILKKIVNDSNDKNGQIQITLPFESDSDEEDESTSSSDQPTVSPEPDVVKPPARSTRSSLLKSEAAELKEATEATNNLSLVDTKSHRAAEMGHSERGYDWKARLQKRDFEQGSWILIVVGLLNRLSRDSSFAQTCANILAKLAPLDKKPTVETAMEQYQALDINDRVSILQVLCMKSLETKAIKNYIEECGIQMTEHRKERNEIRRNWRAAADELRQLHGECKALQPEGASASPPPELMEIEEPQAEADEEEPEEQEEEDDPSSIVVPDSEEDDPHQGRSLRRASDRAFVRKKRAEEDKLRKAAAAAEKAKKPSKEEREYEKLLSKIEATKEQIKAYEDEMDVVENDLREADCPRTRVLGKDRFWNRYYWMERNAMPFAGLPTSSTADAGYANGCIWVQGPDDIEREGFIELSPAENAQYAHAFQMSVPQRRDLEEGETHLSDARHWGYYDNPDALDMLIGWLDNRGSREIKLRKELTSQREYICRHMTKRQEYLAGEDDSKSEAGEPATRISTRNKTYVDASGHRCLKWRNSTALEEVGHLHSQPKPGRPRKQRGVARKVEKKVMVEEEPPMVTRVRRRPRQVRGGSRGTARTSGRLTARTRR